jgi:hypothetical protein
MVEKLRVDMIAIKKKV